MAERPARVKVTKPPGADYEIRIIGARPTPLRDLYHGLLRRSYAVLFGAITAVYLLTNALFAAGYLLTGGVAHARPGSFLDAFFFSVQTMGTIGYGALYPESPAAGLLVVAESIVGLILTAMATGLVFAKFSRPTARLVFSREATIAPMNGCPTLSLRIGNERGNQIVDAQLRVILVRTERTSEGQVLYRMIDLKLVRERALSLSRSFTVMHVIDEGSPLFGATPESLLRDEVELQLLVVGLDDTTMQSVHGGHSYATRQILFGARHRDVLSEAEDGALVLDLRRFHEVEATAPTAQFPYSLGAPAAPGP